ncbi:MAG: EamA family transporter [Actinobacteria bacterium]|nr:EamA family transporter [Actinomycetota bacterium]
MVVATLLALGSALVHASWNLLIKTGRDRVLAGWGQFLAAAVVAWVTLCFIGYPGWEAAPYLVATGIVHVAYLEWLVAAYHHGDFSIAYPLARGSGAVLAAVGAWVVLDDVMSGAAWVAIAIAAVGLVSLRWTTNPDASSDGVAMLYALGTGVAISAYSLIDSAGARAVDSGVSYGVASVGAAGTAITLANLARPSRRGRSTELLLDWRRHLAGGVGTLVAYTMVLVAVRQAPVGYVTMLRESSVVLGALVGWLFLGEPMGGRRLMSSAVVCAGLIALIVVGG